MYMRSHLAGSAYLAMSAPKLDFKGNKQFVPSKPCAACGRTMTWRKKWAKTWDEVKYCSDACRLKKGSLRDA